MLKISIHQADLILMQFCILILAAMVLSGCVGAVAPALTASPAVCSATISPTSKSLFSTWTATDCSETVQIHGSTLGGLRNLTLTLKGGATCYCDITLCGTTADGSYMYQSCSYTGGGTSDPGCANLDGRGGTFASNGFEMTVCGSNCTRYW